MKGVKFYHPCVVEPTAIIGEGTKIGQNCYIGKKVWIGKNCSIMQHVTIGKGCVIKDDVYIGPNTSILNDKYPPTHNPKQIVIVEQSVIIGGGCTILPRVTICYRAVVGAGSVVTRDVANNTVVVGNPAKLLMTRAEYDKRKEASK